jgi:hypothetical protein
LGEGRGKWGQSTSNLIRGRTVPVTAGGRQVSERGYKGKGKGVAVGQKGSGREQRKSHAVYICNHNMCIENE